MRLQLFVATLLLLPVLILSSCNADSETLDYTLQTATITDFEASVQVVGDVEAQKQIFLAPYYSAKLEELAEDGATVKKDQIVARLESKDKEEDVNDEELELEVARNDLNEHKKNAAADRIKLDANIELAQKVVAQKKLILDQVIRGTRPEDLRKLDLTRQLAFKSQTQAQEILQLKQELLEKGLSTPLEVLQARLQVAQKTRDLKLADAEYETAKRGETALARQIAQLEYRRAQNELTLARQDKQYEIQKSQLQTRKLEAKIKGIQKELAQDKEELKRSAIKAPMDGTVVISKIWSNKGLTQAKVGDDMRKGRPFMAIANLESILIRTEVEEQFLSYLKPGLVCTVSVPSMPGKVFQGELKHIGVLAKERKGRETTGGLSKVFELEIVPKEKNTQLQPGTSVDVKIPLKQQKQVLTLPKSAIHKRGANNYVILENGTEKPIKLGELNPKEGVILEGLNPGQQVRIPKTGGGT